MKKEYDFRKAKRADFRGLPPLAELGRHTKVRITIMLDKQVLDFFKARAAEPGAAPYQTQINRALRDLVEGRRTDLRDALLKDERFIARISERVAAYSGGPRERREQSQSRAQAGSRPGRPRDPAATLARARQVRRSRLTDRTLARLKAARRR